MPFSIRLLIFGHPGFGMSLKVLVKSRLLVKPDGHEREGLRRTLSRRLPPRLLRDVLPD